LASVGNALTYNPGHSCNELLDYSRCLAHSGGPTHRSTLQQVAKYIPHGSLPQQRRARQRWPHATPTHVCTPPGSFSHCANVWAITCSCTRIRRGELWDHGGVRAVTLVSDW